MSVTVTLSKPITAHGEQLTELTFREPTIKDVRKLGVPYLVHPGGGSTAMEVRVGVVLDYAALLGAVPPSSLDQMSLADLTEVQGAIMGFFGDTTSTESTNDPST